MLFEQYKRLRIPRSNVTRRFQIAEDTCFSLLLEGERIDIDTCEALGMNHLLMVGPTDKSTDMFYLHNIDFKSLGSVTVPGKSALFDPYCIGGKTKLTEKVYRELLSRSVGWSVNKKQTIWRASIKSCIDAGFDIFYTPVKGNKLHLRIVWGNHSKHPPQHNQEQIPFSQINKLLTVFSPYEVEQNIRKTIILNSSVVMA